MPTPSSSRSRRRKTHRGAPHKKKVQEESEHKLRFRHVVHRTQQNRVMRPPPEWLTALGLPPWGKRSQAASTEGAATEPTVEAQGTSALASSPGSSCPGWRAIQSAGFIFARNSGRFCPRLNFIIKHRRWRVLRHSAGHCCRPEASSSWYRIPATGRGGNADGVGRRCGTRGVQVSDTSRLNQLLRKLTCRMGTP